MFQPRTYALVVTVSVAIAACAAPPAPAPVVTPPVVVEPEPPASAVEVLYGAKWSGYDMNLIGVDEPGARAWVRLTTRVPEPRLVIDTIDLTSGERTDRWEATPENALATVNQYPRFKAMTGTFEDDLQRYAQLVRDSGPWAMMGRRQSPTVLSLHGNEAVLYDANPAGGKDGDWIYVKDSPIAKPRRVNNGMRASYDPVLSADGQHLAFRGCHPVAPGRSDCSYFLYLSDLSPKPTRIASVRKPSPPVFTKSGDAVLTVSHTKKQDCLVRVSTAAPHKAQSLLCSEMPRESDFAQSPSGAWVAVGGFAGDAGQQVLEVSRLKLADGTVDGGAKVPRATGVGRLISDHELVLPLQLGGLAIADLATGKVRRVPDADGFAQVNAGRVVDGKMILLKKQRGAFEIVSVDLSHESLEPHAP